MLAAAQDAAAERVLATREAAEPVDPAPGMLVVEAGGVMVRYQDGWHEVKVGLVGGVTDGDLVASSYVAAREGAGAFAPRLLARLRRARRGALDVVGWEGPLGGRSLAVLRPVHVVGPPQAGAPWIWHLADDSFGRRTEAMDFYHASEHLWEVARVLYGAETARLRRAARWAHARRHELYKHGVAPVRAALARLRRGTDRGRGRDAPA